MMRIGNWSWLVVLAAMVPFVIVVLWISQRLYRRRLHAFMAAGLVDRLVPKRGQGVRWLKNSLFITGICFVILALVRPMRTEKEEEVRTPGVDFLIALDLSRSMLVRDMPGSRSRLDFAKEAIRELIKKLSADRVGMIGFAGEARLMVPPTLNYPTFELVLRSASPDSIGFQGSDMERAIKVAADRLKREEKQARILIIISDGEMLSGDAMMAARQAGMDNQVVIFTVGVGTPDGGRIPVDERDLSGKLIKTEYLKDIEDKEIVSRLDEVTLRNIAQMTGGGYAYLSRVARGSDTPNALVQIFEKGVRPLAKSVRISKITSFEELYQIPLLVGLGLLLLDMFIGGRRFKPRAPKAAKVAAFLFFVWFLTDNVAVDAQERETRSRRGTKSKTAPDRREETPVEPPATSTAITTNIPAEKVELDSLGSGTAAEIEKISTEQLPSWRSRKLRQAQELFEKKKLEEAAGLLQQTLMSAPDDIYLLYNYGVVCYAKGSFAEAEAVWSRISPGKDRAVDAAAKFQCGNAAFRIASGLPVTQRSWDSAIMYYRRAQEYYADVPESTTYATSALKNKDASVQNLSSVYESAINHYLKETESYAEALRQTGPSAKIWQMKDRIDGVTATAQKTEYYLAEMQKISANHPLVQGTAKRLQNFLELGYMAKARYAFEEIRRNATPQNHSWTITKHQEAISYYDQVLKLNQNNEDAKKERAQVVRSARDVYLAQVEVGNGLAERIVRIVAAQRMRAARIKELKAQPANATTLAEVAQLEWNMRITHLGQPSDDPEEAINQWGKALADCDTAQSFLIDDDLAQRKKKEILERALNYRKQLAKDYFTDAMGMPFNNDEDADNLVKKLERATVHLQNVKDANPAESSEIEKELATTKKELAERYLRRGDIYWEMGKAKRVTHPDRGVAFLEKADQDFGLALAMNPDLHQAKEKRNAVRSVMLDWRVELSKHIAKIYEKEKEEALAGKPPAEVVEEVNLQGLRDVALQERNLEEQYAGSVKPPEPIFNW